MSNKDSLMRREINEIPEAVARLLERGQKSQQRAVQIAREINPNIIITIARGSSDHVCTYLKYAAELELGLPVASVGPSIASIYKAKLSLDKTLCLTISQSGQSPDIVEMTKMAKDDGAATIAITNNASSHLAKIADLTLNIHAGTEHSVAATKTFVCSAVSGLALIADWSKNKALRRAIDELPEKLNSALQLDWSELTTFLINHSSLFTIGRGPSWAIANEAALKFKEVCQLHAESYSSAEILHGPVSIVNEGFPVLAFAGADAAESETAKIADKMANMGAKTYATSSLVKHAKKLDYIRTGHPLTDPLALIVSLYSMIENLARLRGYNPDMPRNLQKITETI